MQDLNAVGDTLIDHDVVHQNKTKFMIDSYESYTRANILLGYFSQLSDYQSEYDQLMNKVSIYRRDILAKYKIILSTDHQEIFKQLLVLPQYTKWYNQGIAKYKKVRNYSIYYYRQNLLTSLEDIQPNLSLIKKNIDTIILLDRYYDIYDETIDYLMKSSNKFDIIMRRHFSDCIHL